MSATTLERPKAAAPARASLFADLAAAVAAGPRAGAALRAAGALAPLLRRTGLLSEAERALPERGYGRHDVYYCPKGLFTAVAAVWPAGIVSPVHDHLTWCAFGVVEGEIEEVRYRPGNAGAVATGRFRYAAGAATSLPEDGPDIHGIRNPTGRPAVSLHIYGGDARITGPNVGRIYAPEA